MRSRYAAFVLGLGDYLVRTQAGPSPVGAGARLAAWSRSVRWLDLTVHDAPEPEDDQGEVAFTARYAENGVLVSLRERSRFGRRAEGWHYLDGAPTADQVRVPRNAPCPCGSGKKWKACHG
jgi:SEC-C motif-containing protein